MKAPKPNSIFTIKTLATIFALLAIAIVLIGEFVLDFLFNLAVSVILIGYAVYQAFGLIRALLTLLLYGEALEALYGIRMGPDGLLHAFGITILVVALLTGGLNLFPYEMDLGRK